MKLKILAAAFVIGSLAFSTGCDICEILNCPGPGPEPQPGPDKVLFFDDFEDGPDPAWWTNPNSKDRWIVKGGRYTIDENSPRDIPLRTFVGNPSWQNYSVEVDVFDAHFSDQQIAILLRVQSDDDMVGFFVRAGHFSDLVEFKIRKDGIWEVVKSRGYSPRPNNFHLLITVNGNTYSAFINTKLAMTVEILNFPLRGYVGLQTARGGRIVSFDNFKVTSLD